MPSEAVWIAIISAVAGVIGGAIGAIASPLAKDWVAKQDFHRKQVAETARLASETATRSREARRAAVEGALATMGEAMQHYGAEWRGIANYHGRAEALASASRAWTMAMKLPDEAVRTAVDQWKQAIDHADMRYRDGGQPPGHSQLITTYETAAASLASMLRNET